MKYERGNLFLDERLHLYLIQLITVNNNESQLFYIISFSVCRLGFDNLIDICTIWI